VADDAPQALVRDLNVSGYGADRHLADEAHDHLLEKQSEATAFPGPWCFHATDSVFRAVDPRESGRKVAMMLEEVEMPPRVFLEFMRLARGAALRARIQRSTVGTDLQMELGWRMFCIKALTHNFPGWRETKTQGEYLFGEHGNPPEGGLSKLGDVGQFYSKRGRTINDLSKGVYCECEQEYC